MVLVGYALVLVVSGVLVARRKNETPDDYFLGSRSMPWWAVAISLLATSLSAATFIGGPQQAYNTDLTYLSATIGGVIGAFIIALVFIPRFYQHGVSTVYELLEHRFGPVARIWSSVMFMVGRLLASGARIFMAALPLAMIVFGSDADLGASQFAVAIGALVVVGVGYTLIGGVASVIWTDVIQFVVFVGCALIAAVLIWNRIDLAPAEIMQMLRTGRDDGSSKLKLLDVGVNPVDVSANYTLLTALTGWTLFNVAAYGTDQDLAQRLLTCKSASKGSMSIIGGIVVGVPVTLIFMCVGLLLFVFYRTQPPTEYAIDSTPRIFLLYILHELPAGLTGLMLAGLFAAGLSSLNSALNAMASTFVTDIYQRVRPNRPPRHYVTVGRFAVVGWGIVLGLFALGCAIVYDASRTTLLDFALGVMMYAYTGLVAVFLVAMLTRRGNTLSVVLALVSGAAMVGCMRYGWPSVNGWDLLEAIGLGWIYTLSMPWQMMLATTVAAAICMIGSGDPASSSSPAASDVKD